MILVYICFPFWSLSHPQCWLFHKHNSLDTRLATCKPNSLSKVMYKKIITTNIAPKKKKKKKTAHADTHFSPLGNSNDPPLLLDPCWVNHANNTHYHHIITTTKKNPYKASERRRDKRRYTVTKWHTGARERHRVEDPAKNIFISLFSIGHTVCIRGKWQKVAAEESVDC